MENGVTWKIVGIGEVKIRMHDGILRTLKNVWHVPDLKKNLISLRILDSLEYEYSGGGGVIWVKKGSLVVMEGNKVDDLYILQGSMAIDSADVSSSDNFKLSALLAQQSKEKKCFLSHVPYSSAFGSIMRVLVCIRLDASHPVSVVCPEKVHWRAVKMILRYFRSATNVGSVFDRHSGISSNVIGYVDSDYDGDLVVKRGDITLKKISLRKIQ